MKITYIIILILFIFALSLKGQEVDSILSKTELEKLHRELDNPLAKRWSLVFQENFGINNGDLVDGSVISNTMFFQPALPIPFGRNKVFTARPVFTIVTQPDFSADASGGKKVTGFGIYRWRHFLVREMQKVLYGVLVQHLFSQRQATKTSGRGNGKPDLH